MNVRSPSGQRPVNSTANNAITQATILWVGAAVLVFVLGILRRKRNRERLEELRREEYMLPPATIDDGWNEQVTGEAPTNVDRTVEDRLDAAVEDRKEVGDGNQAAITEELEERADRGTHRDQD